MSARPRVLRALLAALLAVGCTETPARLRLEAPTSVVLVVIDTLRADRLGFYGHARPTSPHLDALAREAVVFERAYSPASWTLPAMVSTMTSTWPQEHGVVARPQRLPERFDPLAERLHRAGFRTAAFVANPLAATASGLDRGYQSLTRSQHSVPLDEVAAWLDRAADAPFFLYLHSTEPHLPYTAPPDAYRQLGAEPLQDARALVAMLGRYRALTRREGAPAGSLDARLARQRELLGALERRRDDLLLLYDASVVVADRNVGALHRMLAERGLLERTLLIVLSDHGEEMLEHGGVLHGQSLYAELVRIPMLWRLPGGRNAGLRVDAPVTLVDLVPTLLEVLGVDAPDEARFAGTSFADLLGGVPRRDPEAPFVTSVRVEREFDYATPAPRGDLNVSLLDGPWKAIWNAEPQRLELYHTGRDPTERRDLATREPEVAAALRRAAEAWLRERPSGAGESAPEGDIDPTDLEQLRALGYVE